MVGCSDWGHWLPTPKGGSRHGDHASDGVTYRACRIGVRDGHGRRHGPGTIWRLWRLRLRRPRLWLRTGPELRIPAATVWLRRPGPWGPVPLALRGQCRGVRRLAI